MHVFTVQYECDAATVSLSSVPVLIYHTNMWQARRDQLVSRVRQGLKDRAGGLEHLDQRELQDGQVRRVQVVQQDLRDQLVC